MYLLTGLVLWYKPQPYFDKFMILRMEVGIDFLFIKKVDEKKTTISG